MTQEVQVILTLEVDVTQEKSDIAKFIKELINTHTFHSSPHSRMTYSKLEISSIKEESEIYQNE